MFAIYSHILELADMEDQNDEYLRHRRSRLRLRELDPVSNLLEADIIKSFRFDKTTLKALIAEISALLPQRRRRDAISPETKVLVALSFYATGSYQTLVGQSSLHNVSQKSVSRSVRQVTEVLNSDTIFKKYIKWPVQIEARNRIKAKFFQKFGLPGLVGCVDGTHIAILRPVLHEERFFNRKGYHSLNVMIICDCDLNILWVDAANPGAAHDSRVWLNSQVHSQLNNIYNTGEQVYLLGDSGYPLRKTMMTPILNTTEGTPENYYYKKHVSARNTVERCIGVLKARFRCLLAARALHYDPTTAAQIVQACCVLHNIANNFNVETSQLTPEEAQQEAAYMPLEVADLQEHNRRVNPDLQEGRAFQRALLERLWEQRNSR